MKRILIISSYSYTLVNFRLHLIKKLINYGHKVTALVPVDKDYFKTKKKLTKLGVNCKSLILSRTGLNFFKDFLSYKFIYNVFKNYSPDIVLAYNVKPVIYSGLAIKNFTNISFYPTITGLGYGFINGRGLKKFIINRILTCIYRIALKYSKKIFFQNSDDMRLFNQLNLVPNKNRSYVVNGSGVDLKKFSYVKLPTKPIFLMLSRILVDKGVKEYVEAACIVKKKYPNAKFLLAGMIDSNPSALTLDELNLLNNRNFVKYLGEIHNVKKIIASCKYYVLPSYREGLPRSVLEALAMGRPIITTNVPGCRETVLHKINGLLVNVRSSKSLANAMIKIIKKKNKEIKYMSKASLDLAKNKFDVEKINSYIFKLLNLN
jgi:glycosyltransferase involved in cell wall biosynthesis